MKTRQWLDNLQPGDTVAVRICKNARNTERVVQIVHVETAGPTRKLHFSDGTFWPETAGREPLHRGGQRRRWIGPCQ